jgi:ribonuclease-3
LVGTDGPDHDRVFTVAIELHDEEISVGAGRSKIEAEQAAAGAALEKWAQEASTEPDGSD